MNRYVVAGPHNAAARFWVLDTLSGEIVSETTMASDAIAIADQLNSEAQDTAAKDQLCTEGGPCN